MKTATKACLGAAAAALVLTGCNTFTVASKSVANGTTLHLQSVTPCPPVPPTLFEMLVPWGDRTPEPAGTAVHGFHWDKFPQRAAWTMKVFTYSSVQDYPMNPFPFSAPGIYTLAPQCLVPGIARDNGVTQAYAPQQVRVGGPHGVAAPVSAARGARIRISGTYCRPGDTAVAGILYADQENRTFTDPKLLKAFAEQPVAAGGSWSVSVKIPTALPAGTYIVRSECLEGEEVSVGFAPRLMTLR